ncbi:MAG TPA: hypothetical protein VGF61_21115 [Candidatus Acidoferrum sp.]|jgi:Tol biopolymer transport system component
MALSPNGDLIAYVASLSSPTTQTVFQKLALVQVDPHSGASPRLLDVDPRATQALQFTADGKSVAYVINDGGVDNIWVEPLDGSKGRQITKFSSKNISSFHWSPNGKSLALVRWDSTSDVILLRDSNALPK